MDRRLIVLGLLFIFALVCGASLYTGLVGYNDNQNWQVYQPPFGGEVSIISTPGYYCKNFGKVWTFPLVIEDEYTEKPTVLSPSDDSISASFNDGGTAKISAYVRVELPTDSKTRLYLHQQFNGNLDSISNAVKAHLVNCVKASAPVMSASEHQASRNAEFKQIIESQLIRGLFKMRRTEIELDDLTTIEDVGIDANGNKITREKKARVQATQVITDADGRPVVDQESPLKRYGLEVTQFSIVETTYDPQTMEQFANKKKSYLAAEQAKAQRQEEVQQRLMIEERGRRQVADVQAEENQKRERAIIQANQAADVAVIAKTRAVTEAEQRSEVALQLKKETENLREIARIKAETAELDKKAIIAAAEAQQKAIELGGGISEKERVLAQISADRDARVAEHLSKVGVPTVVMSGGEGTDIGSSLLNLKLLQSTGILK